MYIYRNFVRNLVQHKLIDIVAESWNKVMHTLISAVLCSTFGSTSLCHLHEGRQQAVKNMTAERSG